MKITDLNNERRRVDNLRDCGKNSNGYIVDYCDGVRNGHTFAGNIQGKARDNDTEELIIEK